MLRLHEEEHDRGRMVVGLVVRDGRPAAVARSHDAEPDVRECRNGAGRPSDRDGRRTVQNHEGGRTPADRVRAVPRQERQRGQVNCFADSGRSSQSHPR
ncbi:hypothetical protein C0J52_01320 [Blattella germanica]|nr:hypothetical protein C0J52_01320 [Blattella germanica]